MINLFDLSAQMAGTKLLTDKAHRDVSPIRRKSDAKRDRDSSPINSNEKPASSDLIRKKMNTNTKGTPMKTLLDKEMSKESEFIKKPNNVIAKLMGLDDSGPVNNFNKSQGPICKNAQTRRLNYGRHSFDEIIQYKDVYEVQDQSFKLQNGRMFNDQRLQNGRMFNNDERLQLQNRRMFNDQRLRDGRMFDDDERLQLQNGRVLGDERLQLQNGRMVEGKQDKRLDLVREKILEAKRLASNKKLLNSKEFEDALEVLSTNQDLFLKFLEEPNNIFSGPQKKRITVLKPLKNIENEKNSDNKSSLREIKRERPVQSESFSHPTRIVVLKPSPVKSGGHFGNFDTSHRRDESLISSICSNGSNGYGGDESSLYDKSDNDNDSEVMSPISYNSRDYIAKFEGPNCSPESSVIKEAKKRLSERWNNTVPVQVPVPRSSSTLGEMLSIQDMKKDSEMGQTGQMGQISQTGQMGCLTMGRKSGTEEIEGGSFMGLVRSKSLPVSSSLFDNLNLNPNLNLNLNLSLSLKKNLEVGKGSSNKGKLSFKGKVSSFFFNRNKKTEKEKICTDFKAPAQHKDEFSSSSSSNTTNNMDIPVDDNISKSGIFSTKGNISIEKPNNLSIYSNEIYEKPKPSPTSVLELLPFDDSNFESSSQVSSITSQQPPLSRSSFIESVSRTLSFDENSFESPIHPQIREKEQFDFVRNLISSSGFEIEKDYYNVLSRFYSLDSALDPLLLEEFIERKTEEAKCRERRSNQRLLFDCVNLALLQIGHSSLRNYYPWARNQNLLNLNDGFLGGEVWRVVRDWISSERELVFEERENPSLVVERIVKREIFEEREWEDLLRWFQREEISREIQKNVLDDLVREVLGDFGVLCL